MKKIGKEYLSYMEKKLKYFQKQCDTIFKRQINQVLILHVNSINADYLDQLLTIYENNGYSFISLDEALKDKIYQTEDKFYQGGGHYVDTPMGNITKSINCCVCWRAANSHIYYEISRC